jgi:hypothetical protein
MHETAIRRLDRAALELVQALETYGQELKPYLGAENLETLQGEVVNLRRVLLGLAMGVLYQDGIFFQKRTLRDISQGS